MAPAEDLPHANLTPTQMRQGIERLQRQIDKVREFDPRPRDLRHQQRMIMAETLDVSVDTAPAQTFGEGTIEYKRYVQAATFACPLHSDRPTSETSLEMLAALMDCRSRSLLLLGDAVSFLTEELKLASAQPPASEQSSRTRAERWYGEAKPKDGGSTSAVLGSKVFIVHGHDEAALHAVARLLGQLGLEFIILREQPSQGRTIIEKFEDCAGEVGFAVIIMTPDDIVAEPSSATRARQNVIFELGYFAGKLGRGRTCVLRKGDVEIPSDLYGVLYIDLDGAGGWKLELAKELRAAGLKVNMERML